MSDTDSDINQFTDVSQETEILRKSEIDADKVDRTPDCSDLDNVKWRSIRVCYVVMFFTSVSYSIQMTSMWPYMITLNSLYTKEFLGWVVAAYSIGQLVSCPVFSFISGRTNNFRLMLFFSFVLQISSNYLYAVLEDISNDNGQKVSLLASRVLSGFGGGNVAAVRLFLTLATCEEERLEPMAILSASQALGFVLGPGLQAAFYPIGVPRDSWLDTRFFRFNMYTAGAYFNIFASVVVFILLIFVFSEKFLVKSNKESFEDFNGKQSDGKQFKNEYMLAVFMLIAFFVCMMSLSILETVLTPVVMDNFAWSKSYATLIISIGLSVSGVCSFFVFLSLRFVVKLMKESKILVIAFIFVLCSAIIMIPWGSGRIPLLMIDLVTNSSAAPEPIVDPASYNGTGCDVLRQSWCLFVPVLQFWQYICCLGFFTIGYPVTNILSYVMFSRLIDPQSQSLWMGILTAVGSFARIIGPIFISWLYHRNGTQIAFGSWAAIILLLLVFSPVFLLRMHRYEKRKFTYTAVRAIND